MNTAAAAATATPSLLRIPSFLALAATGLAILLIAIMWVRRTPVQTMTLITLIAILVGIHGILHLGVEQAYGYYPL